MLEASKAPMENNFLRVCSLTDLVIAGPLSGASGESSSGVSSSSSAQTVLILREEFEFESAEGESEELLQEVEKFRCRGRLEGEEGIRVLTFGVAICSWKDLQGDQWPLRLQGDTW